MLPAKKRIKRRRHRMEIEMKPVRIKDIVEAVSGTLMWGSESAEVSSVVTDSRQVEKGTLFVPIIGERVDAHRFIPEVLKAGAACVFSSDPAITADQGAGIYVKDTLCALQQFAAWYRRQFTIPVIGITGSVGKTTTKEMIAAVLESRYHTLKTIGNWNSQIGVALMMFHIEEQTEIAVFEMGISMPGEMDSLVDMARPQTAVLTNIGVSHIGNLGSRENICAEKGKIIKNFPQNGVLYVCGNGDLRELSGRCIPYEQCQGACQTVYYGTETGDDFYGDQVQTEGNKQSFVFHYPGGEEKIVLSVAGIHNVNNAVAALALALKYDVPLKKAKQALEAYQPIAMRGVVKEVSGVHIIDDTYNASPDSIRSNLRALFDQAGTGRTIAVLADVLELGEQAKALHEEIGRFIVQESACGRTLSFLITVGENAGYISSYTAAHSDIKTVACAAGEQAAEMVKQYAKRGDWVLVKGSRGMHMDEVVKRLIKE